jgi:prepilin-type N-terminal cleavage/methylation domain-containing protein
MIRSQQAFTIVELLVVIGIMATLITIASVSISNSLRNARLKDSTRELQGELVTIRNRARTQQRIVVVQMTATSITAFYDMNNDKVYDAAVDFIDVSNPPNGVFDAGVDTPGLFFQHTYTNGIQFTVSSIPGAAALVPLTTFRFNAAGNIDDDNRVITVSLNTEPKRQYRIWLFTTGNTRVERSEDAGVTWPTRPW